MATIEDFETALKEVVTAKRLSQSKMTSLTEIAMRCMGNDTQMVSILYRTHKGLSSGGKTWSLYAFDALARAARHQVSKNQINPSQANGNCATFLRKIEGVLDGLFEDIATAGTGDLKEKAKKILDIWAKSNTFPSAVLSPLYALLKQAENDKELAMPPDQSANPTHNPYAAMPALPPNQAPNPQPSVTPLVGADIQTALFALLSKAANAAGTNGVAHGQTPPNIGPATAPSAPAVPLPPVLDVNQLAFLHHLAQTAKGVAPASAQPQPPGVVQQQPVLPSLVPSNSAVPVVPPSAHSANVGGISHPQVYRDDHYGPPSAHARESEHPQYAHSGQYTPDAAAGQSRDPRAAGGYLRGNDYGTPSHDRDAAVRANLTPAGPKPTYDAPGAGYDRTPDPDSSYGYDRDNERDPRRDSYRDGPPRGYRGSPGGRGRGRGRWDDRRGPGDYPPHDRSRDRDHRDDYRDRDRDFDDRARDRDHRRRRDSRSWSPQGRRRGRPPYSPSRRRGPRDRDGRGDSESGFRERYTYVPGRDGAEPGFDEFGREVRPSSPERERQPEPPREPEYPRSDSGSVQTPNVNTNAHPSISQGRNESPFPSGSASASVTVSDGGSVAPEDHHPGQGFPSTNRTHQPPTAQSSYAAAPSEPSTSTMASLSPAPSASSATLPPASSLTSTSTSTSAVDGLGDSGGEGGGGLDTFDREAFDPSQPASWAALGQAWATTHGHAPSQEELVQFVFGSALPAPAAPSESLSRDYGDAGYGRGYGRGGRGGPGFRGRGGDGEGYDAGRGGRGRGFGYGRGGRGGEYGARGKGEFEGYARGDYGPPRGGRGRGRGEHFGGAGREEYGYDDSGYGGPGQGGYGGGGRGAYGARGAYGGGGRGDGGGGYGYGYGEYQDTDAVTLTGSGSGDDSSWQVPSGYEAPTSLPYGSEDTEQGGNGGGDENQGGGGGGSSGKMQKVGDRWVFVRGTN